MLAQVLRDKVDPDKTKRQVGEETSEQLLLERATRSVNGLCDKSIPVLLISSSTCD